MNKLIREVQTERLRAIARYLASVNDFGKAEDLLLTEWVAKSKSRFSFSYDNRTMDLHDVRFLFGGENGSISGVEWTFDRRRDYLGDFYIKLFGWEFSHPAVMYENEDDWYSYDWWNASPELSAAIDAHIGGNIPYPTDYGLGSSGIADVCCTKNAIENERRIHGDMIRFYADTEGRIFMDDLEKVRERGFCPLYEGDVATRLALAKIPLVWEG